jgi:hypothetical protein
LVALPPEARLAALAALDPATISARRRHRRRGPATDSDTGDDQPGAA